MLAEFTNCSFAEDKTDLLETAKQILGHYPYSTEGRPGPITAIVVHHQAGYAPTGEDCILGWINHRYPDGDDVSSNYCVGDDGTIALFVEEAYRAWTTNGRDPDDFSVTIEVSNAQGAGAVNGSDDDPEAWKVSQAAWDATVKLMADVCQRNGISSINYTGDKTGNLLMHRWYAGTACPGGYMMANFSRLADEVNAVLAGSPVGPVTPGSTNTSYTPANKIIFNPYPTVVELGSTIQVTTDATGCPIVLTTDNSSPEIPDSLCDLGDECDKALEGDYKKVIQVQRCTHIRAIAIDTDNTIKAQGAGTFIVKWKRPKDEDVQSIIETIERETNLQPYLALNLEEKKEEVRSFKEVKTGKNAY